VINYTDNNFTIKPIAVIPVVVNNTVTVENNVGSNTIGAVISPQNIAHILKVSLNNIIAAPSATTSSITITPITKSETASTSVKNQDIKAIVPEIQAKAVVPIKTDTAIAEENHTFSDGSLVSSNYIKASAQVKAPSGNANIKLNVENLTFSQSNLVNSNYINP
jgi:hypothetical protein